MNGSAPPRHGYSLFLFAAKKVRVATCKGGGTAVLVSTAVENTPLIFLANFPGGKKTKESPVGPSG
jgi:hypothetical protein